MKVRPMRSAPNPAFEGMVCAGPCCVVLSSPILALLTDQKRGDRKRQHGGGFGNAGQVEVREAVSNREGGWAAAEVLKCKDRPEKVLLAGRKQDAVLHGPSCGLRPAKDGRRTAQMLHQENRRIPDSHGDKKVGDAIAACHLELPLGINGQQYVSRGCESHLIVGAGTEMGSTLRLQMDICIKLAVCESVIVGVRDLGERIRIDIINRLIEIRLWYLIEVHTALICLDVADAYTEPPVRNNKVSGGARRPHRRQNYERDGSCATTLLDRCHRARGPPIGGIPTSAPHVAFCILPLQRDEVQVFFGRTLPDAGIRTL